jgi:hypothetical protein
MQLLDNLIWMRNRAWSPKVSVPRLMFYHIPKTGGMFVYHCLGTALLGQSKLIEAANPGFPGIKYGRVDVVEDLKQVDQLWMIATHLPYGWHLDYKFQPPFQLFTLVRDPFDRVLSNYTYNCMRSSKQPTLEEFWDFAALRENCNTMVRHFCDGRTDVSQALGILQRDFLAFDTAEHIAEMIEGLLNYANLPNVMVQGKINYTLDQYRLDAAVQVRSEVESLNRADTEFYREIQENPRRLPITDGEGYHPLTMLLKESGGSAASLTRVQSVGTDELLKVVARSQSGQQVFDTFIK